MEPSRACLSDAHQPREAQALADTLTLMMNESYEQQKDFL